MTKGTLEDTACAGEVVGHAAGAGDTKIREGDEHLRLHQGKHRIESNDWGGSVVFSFLTYKNQKKSEKGKDRDLQDGYLHRFEGTIEKSSNAE